MFTQARIPSRFLGRFSTISPSFDHTSTTISLLKKASFNKAWQAMNIMRSENHIDKGMLLHNAIDNRFFLRHTTTYTKNKSWLLRFQCLQMTKLTEHFIFGILTNRTRIQQDDICNLLVFCADNPFARKDPS